MQINFHQKNLHLSDEQKDYIQAKVEALSKFKAMEDESVVVRVDVDYREHADTDRKILMCVTANIPKHVIRAEEECVKIEEGIDLIEPKLRHQLEKYKTAHE